MIRLFNLNYSSFVTKTINSSISKQRGWTYIFVDNIVYVFDDNKKTTYNEVEGWVRWYSFLIIWMLVHSTVKSLKKKP